MLSSRPAEGLADTRAWSEPVSRYETTASKFILRACFAARLTYGGPALLKVSSVAGRSIYRLVELGFLPQFAGRLAYRPDRRQN